jgi:hypothetical protein
MMEPSRLAGRLREILRPPRSNHPGGSAPLVPDVVSDPSESSRASIGDLLGGAWQPQGSGRCFVVEQRVLAGERHGDCRVGAFAQSIDDAADQAELLGQGAPKPPFVFFDLETTGLNGGAGTCAFLVGLGWFDADRSFVTRQFILTRASDERVMLEAVGVDLRRAGALVSFNGKSFDAPMLETRHLFHRLGWMEATGGAPHLDVLHPSRRFWGRGVGADCSLGALERKVLGATRVGDVPGSEIPERYFRFVRSGDPRPLAAVLAHNRLDLLTLAGLTARLLRLVQDGPSETQNPEETLALGELYSRADHRDRARAAFERTVALQGRSLVTVAALRALALMERRGRRYGEAARLWQAMLDVPECPLPLAREATAALAIHHEHRVRDFDAAREFALKSLDSGTGPQWADAVRYRLARIERKMGAAPLVK